MALAPSFPLKTQIPRQAEGILEERGAKEEESLREGNGNGNGGSDIYKGGKIK